MCRQGEVILYYYEELPQSEELVQHLTECEECRDFLCSVTEVLTWYRQLPRAKVSEELSSRIQMASARAVRRAAAGYWLRVTAGAALVVLIACIAVVVVGREHPLPPRAVTIKPSSEAAPASVREVDWQTDLGWEIARLSADLRDFPAQLSSLSRQRECESMDDSIAHLDVQIQYCSRQLQSGDTSYLVHSLDRLKERIDELDAEIGQSEELK